MPLQFETTEQPVLLQFQDEWCCLPIGWEASALFHAMEPSALHHTKGETSMPFQSLVWASVQLLQFPTDAAVPSQFPMKAPMPLQVQSTMLQLEEPLQPQSNTRPQVQLPLQLPSPTELVAAPD